MDKKYALKEFSTRITTTKENSKHPDDPLLDALYQEVLRRQHELWKQWLDPQQDGPTRHIVAGDCLGPDFCPMDAFGIQHAPVCPMAEAQ